MVPADPAEMAEAQAQVIIDELGLLHPVTMGAALRIVTQQRAGAVLAEITPIATALYQKLQPRGDR
jgi:hypothetical protein